MAKPSNPIIIWAEQDVNLPGTGKPNKSRPIDDLLAKGYDKGQKPAAEEFNYVLNSTTSWIRYISDEQIPALDSRYLVKNLNLSDIPDVESARRNLNIYSKDQMDQRYVNVDGDTMTGALEVPRVNFTGAANTDMAYIQAQAVGDDITAFDFVFGDNAGAPGGVGIDAMRFRFVNTQGVISTLADLVAKDEKNAYFRVFGEIWGRKLTVEEGIYSGDVNTTTLSWGGSASGTSLSLSGGFSSPSVTTTSLTVSENQAKVGGRNVVRSVNGVTANQDGDLSLNIKTTNAWLGGEHDGWWKDENTGVIEQWGMVAFNKPSSTQEYIPFHISFPTACQNIQLCNFEDFNNEGNTWRVKTKNQGGFVLSNGGGNMYTAYMWRAVGY